MPAVWSFEAIGTRWEIAAGDPLPREARAAVAAVIAAFDQTWSRFRDDSVVARLAASGGTAELTARSGADAAAMLEAYAALDEATGGAVNPLVGDALARRGYDAAYSLVDRGPSPAPPWRGMLAWSGDRLTLAGPATIDVGALGKGRLVDLVSAVLEPWAAGGLVVDASGDLRVHGPAVRVALEHPYDLRRAVGVVEVADAALCASATNRRAWGDGLHHVLDARTGAPVRAIAATWAIADDAMHADAIATALFFDGGPRLAADWGVEWVRMTTDGRLEWSPGNRAELFL